MLLSVGLTSPAPASERLATPTAASIESLLRDMLVEDDLDMPSLMVLQDAMLLDFELVVLDQVSPPRWHAEIVLLFDFGPPPPSILGFERIRRGRYRLVLKQHGTDLGLSRFTPVARVHPLPVAD